MTAAQESPSQLRLISKPCSKQESVCVCLYDGLKQIHGLDVALVTQAVVKAEFFAVRWWCIVFPSVVTDIICSFLKDV